jgi:peptidylprolyl isomerase
MRRVLLIIAACAALALAGCGSDDDSTSSTPRGGETTSEKPANESPPTERGGSEMSPAEAAKLKKPKVTVPQGAAPKKLETKDLRRGTGATAKAGDEVTVQYVGVGYKTRKEFDASWNRGEPFVFTLGAGMVIPGWDQGIEGMKVGGQRELVIPPELAYGPAGAPPSIGPNETLIFVVDLIGVS